MKVIFHELFYIPYTMDPASESGRMEAVMDALPDHAEIVAPDPATEQEILRAHTPSHVEDVKREGVYEVAAMAAGGAILAARTGLDEPSFGAIRPPGHHASPDGAWGFCFFNNMAIALLALKAENLIDTAMVLDIDLHYGDGTDNVLQREGWVRTHNIAKSTRETYIGEVGRILSDTRVDMIGISAGFDNHKDDWGGLLSTGDYHDIGRMVRQWSEGGNRACFAILEGGYNHKVLGRNAAALMNGLWGESSG